MISDFCVQTCESKLREQPIIWNFSFFENKPDARIRGLVVPHAGKELLDSSNADDTMLYLQGNNDNL